MFTCSQICSVRWHFIENYHCYRKLSMFWILWTLHAYLKSHTLITRGCTCIVLLMLCGLRIRRQQLQAVTRGPCFGWWRAMRQPWPFCQIWKLHGTGLSGKKKLLIFEWCRFIIYTRCYCFIWLSLINNNNCNSFVEFSFL